MTAANEHNERHLKRNAKRQRLGLQLTAPFAAEEESVDGSSGSVFSREDSESSDEAMEIDDIEPGHAEKVGDLPKPLKQNIFKGVPTATVTAVNSTKESTRRQSTGQLAGPGKQAASGLSPVVGYQGTARKTSISDKDPTRSGEARRPSVGGKDSSQSGASRKPSISGKTQTKPRQAMVKTTNAAGPSSTLAKKFQAVRTTRPAAISSVVEPARIRKRRSSLKESMMDVTKQPKLFRSHRKMNAARKRGQELNDTAPLNASAIPASFFITNDKPKQSATAEIPATQSPTISSADDQATNETRKSRKSVRFTEDAIFEEPAEIESPLEAPGPVIAARDVTQAPKKKLSLAAYQERTGNQAVAKTASFGPEGSRCIRILLNGITRAQLPWLKSFMEDTSMHFQMICVADDFFGTLEIFYENHNKLASGVVECPEPEDMTALEAVGKNLRRTQAAFYLPREEYSILIYPSQCDAWAGLADPTSPSPTPLNHVVFRPSVPIDLGLYRPLVSSDESNDGSGSVDIDICLKVMNELVDVDLEALRTKPDFYLIHYPSEIYLFQMVALWLRSIVPGCHIFTSGHVGSWAKFVQEGNNDGTVILHESVLKIIRKIPRLWDSLNHGNRNLWYLTSSGQEPTLSPWGVSETLENDSLMSLPRLKLTRLFPYGCAIFITPSFAISEPAELCRLLSWFKEESRTTPCVLVGCADFPEYLRGLVLDKAQEADQLKQSSDLFLGKELSDRGLSGDDLKDRLRAWELICDIAHAGKGYGYDLEEASEDIRKTAWASESIDPNDEQSLFNWFAWWSTTRLTNYRKFYVIGSRARGISRARKTVRIPNYATHVVGDPDVAFARFVLNSTESRNDLTTRYVFQSTMFPSDRAADLKPWILDLKRSRYLGWARLFEDPVSWVDVQMADSFEDPKCEYATFTNWFCSMPRFHQSGNTLIGLFYTIDTDWTGSTQSENSGRHPWIAVYRPVNPHHIERGYKDMELFLWDCDFAKRSRGASARDPPPLLPMQRRLIEFVREEAPKRFDEYSLARVWIGDFPFLPTPDLSHPIDVTCRSLDYLLKNLYELLNPFELKLKDQGWKLVEREGMHNLWMRPSAREEADAFPKAVSDIEHPEVTIFHAPQGDRPGHGQSQCRNRLYDAAFRARKADRRALTLDYQYQPTLEWYHALKEEGRSHSYVKVDSWDRALDDLMGR